MNNGNQITHTYDAAGSKLSSRYHTRRTPTMVPVGNTVQSTAGNAWTTGTDYVGSYEYSVSGTCRSLNRIHNAEGYTLYCSAQEHYPFYFTRDHLGNTREVKVCIGNDYSEMVQRTQYYPSGLPWNMAFGAGEQPYKYNGNTRTATQTYTASGWFVQSKTDAAGTNRHTHLFHRLASGTVLHRLS